MTARLTDFLVHHETSEIARRCGVTKQAALAWKRGAMPQPHHYQRIADLLGVDVGQVAAAIIAQVPKPKSKRSTA